MILVLYYYLQKYSVSQMASNKAKSLLNVRDSLQNFYNIARLTQQTTVLQEIDAIGQDNDETNQQQTVKILEIDDDDTQSQHESDDDILEDMDITPGNIETPIITKQSQISSQSNFEIEHIEKVPETFLFEIPTFEDAEEADKKIENELKKMDPMTGKTNVNLADLSNLTTASNSNSVDVFNLSATEHDEEDEKLMEISDPSKMSKTLAEVNANQNRQNSTSPIGEQESDNDDDKNHNNKPLKRRHSRKRKLNDTDFENENENIPIVKKRKLSLDKISIDKNIGLNEGQIENSLQKLYNMEDKIVEENILLNSYQSLAIRNSEHVTPIMIDECRQLLDLFGIPYITAPSEAEAQCAELNKLGLVDGIITDDSDVFLFGGKIIYKNLFHLNKYVEKYTNTLIQSKLGLTQNKLISLAMLLGSDYTDGVKNIGPVNGIEIIQTFCSEKEKDFNGLKEFKNWIYSTEPDKKPKKKPDLKIQSYEEYISLKKIWFKHKHKNLKKKWFVDLHKFPEMNVIETYLNPEVDSSNIAFKWGKPDINKLKIICKEKFEWDQRTINLTLDPINDIIINGKDRHIQTSILSFADIIAVNKKPKSKRIQKAVKDLIQEIQLKKQMDDVNISV